MSVTISSLNIINFKGLVDRKIDFGLGLTTIQGPNFSGKTTITQALLYALYGPTVVPGEAKDMVNSAKGGKASVELTLSDGHVIQRAGGNATLLKDGEPVARSASIVAGEVKNILGLEKDQTLKTKVSQQGEAQLLLATGNVELKRLVEDLAGCNVIDEILTLSRGQKKQLNGKLDGLQEAYIGDDAVDALLQELSQAKADASRMTVDLEVAQKAYATSVDTRDELQGALSSTRLANKMAEENLLDRSNLNGRIATLEESVAESTKVLGGENSEALNLLAAPLRKTRDQARKHLEEARSRSLDLKDAVEAVQKKAARVQSLKESLQKENDALGQLPNGDVQRGIVKLIDEQQAVAQAEVARLTSAIENSACPECGRDYDEEHGFDKAAAAEKLAKCQETAKEAGLSRDVEGNTLQLIEKHARESATFQSIFDDSEAELAILEEAASVAGAAAEDDDIDALRTAVEDLIPELEKLSDRIADVTAAETAIANSEKKLSTCRAALEELPSKAIEIQDTSEQEEALAAENVTLGDFKAQVAELESSIKFSVSSRAAYETRVEEAQAVKESLTDTIKNLALHSKLITLISKNRATLMQNVWSGILQEATNFVSTVTEGYVSNVSVDDAFKVVYTEGSQVFPVTSASGSQKSLIGLGIRLGIGNLLPNNAGFFIMDEVTADMEESVSVLAMTVAKTKCPQIIAVSHRDSDMTASDAIVTTTRA